MSGDGMASMITALTATETGITSAKLWGEAAAAAPLIITLFIFGFGFSIVRHLLKSKRGNVRV